MTGQGQFEVEDEGGGGALSLERALSAVLKRLKLVVAFPLVAAMLVGTVVMMMPDRFDASAVIQIDPRQKSITNLDSVVEDLKGDQPTIESEVEIIQSRPIILRVIET
ncbi:MAG: Wzz/FepE/Etk N-terminal domain-containing protein, partial [Hyphomicrobium sp.]